MTWKRTRADGRTDNAATMCSPDFFVEHNETTQLICCQNKCIYTNLLRVLPVSFITSKYYTTHVYIDSLVLIKCLR